jgi:adenosylhomocysteine nucleosidase
MKFDIEIVIIISADIEWNVLRNLLPSMRIYNSPLGEYFQYTIDSLPAEHKTIFFHGGWGKISAAASTQFVIDRWKPKLLINLGTCGGFDGKVDRGVIILADKTIVYDIFERMGDLDSHIEKYSTILDLSWLREPYPERVLKTLLISGDRDLDPGEINELKAKYDAVAGDWESGAIAYVANLNNVPCLILRGVSDLVSESGGEAYEEAGMFDDAARMIMNHLIKSLPEWIKNADVFTAG